MALELVIYYCEAESESLCLIDQVRIEVPLVAGGADGGALEISHEVVPPPTS